MEIEQRDLLVNLLYKVTNEMDICSYTRALGNHTAAKLKFFSFLSSLVVLKLFMGSC